MTLQNVNERAFRVLRKSRELSQVGTPPFTPKRLKGLLRENEPKCVDILSYTQGGCSIYFSSLFFFTHFFSG